jgi:hypothetical protein
MIISDFGLLISHWEDFDLNGYNSHSPIPQSGIKAFRNLKSAIRNSKSSYYSCLLSDFDVYLIEKLLTKEVNRCS